MNKDKKKSSRLSAKEAYNNYIKQVKANRFARKKTTNEYTKKLTNLKLQFKNEYKTTSDKNLKLNIKRKYLETKFNLENERDYALAKLNFSQRTKDKKKMKVDKRISYKKYKNEKHNIDLKNKSNVKTIHSSYVEQRLKLKKEEKAYFNSKPKKDESYHEQIELFKTRKIDQINFYETQIRKNKIWYKNTILQLQQVRDLSYQYELDSFFLLKRWYYGIGKEFQRMSWPSGKKTLKDFIIVICVSAVLIVMFLVLDLIFFSF